MTKRALPCILTAAIAVGVTSLRAQTPTFRTGIDLATFGVTVVDKKGEYLTDLNAEDFEIVEDGQKQTLKYFARGTDIESGPEMHVGIEVGEVLALLIDHRHAERREVDACTKRRRLRAQRRNAHRDRCRQNTWERALRHRPSDPTPTAVEAGIAATLEGLVHGELHRLRSATSILARRTKSI